MVLCRHQEAHDTIPGAVRLKITNMKECKAGYVECDALHTNYLEQSCAVVSVLGMYNVVAEWSLARVSFRSPLVVSFSESHVYSPFCIYV